jgi:cation diffusion facilitator CzcD-associated flavoprotein CzcO
MTIRHAREHVYDAVIVGAGFGGIGVAIELQKLDLNDFVILERADDVGGTWRDNTYPGLEVDIPSFTYSYKFEPKVWSAVYARGAEVQEYAQHCATKYGIRPHIRFGQTVVRAEWDETSAVWTAQLATGDEVRARFLIDSSGFLSGPKLPNIEGIEQFEGKMMHTARWDHDYDLDGKRVGLIGTGATGIQVGPAIADRVAHLSIYQRHAIWCAPKPNHTYGPITKRLMAVAPRTQRVLRAANFAASEVFFGLGFVNYQRFPGIFTWCEGAMDRWMRGKIEDPQLQEALAPDYTFVCKRPALSNVFYPMFNHDDVDLVTTPISHVTRTGIATTDGDERELDVIICATGFKVFDRSTSPSFEVVGKRGKNLGDWWDVNRYQAFGGVSIYDFPNFFMINGPYAAIGASFFDILDSSATHISRLLREARRRGAWVIEVTQAAQERHMARIRRRAPRMVLYAGNCASSNTYYFDRHGDSPAAPAPSSPTENFWRTRFFRLSAYRFSAQPIRNVNTHSDERKVRGL